MAGELRVRVVSWLPGQVPAAVSDRGGVRTAYLNRSWPAEDALEAAAGLLRYPPEAAA